MSRWTRFVAEFTQQLESMGSDAPAAEMKAPATRESAPDATGPVGIPGPGRGGPDAIVWMGREGLWLSRSALRWVIGWTLMAEIGITSLLAHSPELAKLVLERLIAS